MLWGVHGTTRTSGPVILRASTACIYRRTRNLMITCESMVAFFGKLLLGAWAPQMWSKRTALHIFSFHSVSLSVVLIMWVTRHIPSVLFLNNPNADVHWLHLQRVPYGLNNRFEFLLFRWPTHRVHCFWTFRILTGWVAYKCGGRTPGYARYVNGLSDSTLNLRTSTLWP